MGKQLRLSITIEFKAKYQGQRSEFISSLLTFAHHYLEYISHASSKTVNIFVVINSCYNFHYTLYWAFLHLQLNICLSFYLTTNNFTYSTLVCLFSFYNLKECKRAIDESVSGLINY